MLLVTLFGLASLAAAAPTSDPDAVCKYLHDKYPAYTAWDPLNINALSSIGNASLWNSINTDYWDRRNIGNRATCAFFPENAQQVSDAVKQLNKYPSVPFALKSGGHNFNKGFSSVNKGVLISFNQNLAKTVRSSDGQSFVVGPGARWGDVYIESGKTGQVVVGGRLSHIGVGGFILGGGLSYYSAQYGLACDNVIDFEVVLADGTITNANAQKNTDLYWALKGGGNRFAIVTHYTLQAHPAGQNGTVWGGTRLYSEADRDKVFRAVTNFIRNYPDKKAAMIPTFDIIGPLGLFKLPLIFLFYDGPNPGSVFAEFDAIPALSSTTKSKSYVDMANEAGGAAFQGFSTAARVTTFPNLPADQMTQFFQKHWDIYSARAVNNTFLDLDIQFLTFTPQPLSVEIAKASQAQGGNALGLDPNYGDRIWVENDVVWLNGFCDERCPTYLKDTADEVVAYQAKTFPGIAPTNYKSGDLAWASYNPLFMNDAADYQDVYASYGVENEARLKSIQKKYDPKGFMFRQNGWNFQ